MVLTDYEERVLLNLRGCVAANAAAAAQLAQPPNGSSGDASSGGRDAAEEVLDDEALFGKGAEECDDLDGFLLDAAAAAPPSLAAATQSWDHVRASPCWQNRLHAVQPLDSRGCAGRAQSRLAAWRC